MTGRNGDVLSLVPCTNCKDHIPTKAAGILYVRPKAVSLTHLLLSLNTSLSFGTLSLAQTHPDQKILDSRLFSISNLESFTISTKIFSNLPQHANSPTD